MKPTRRRFLKAAGVTLALPFLEATAQGRAEAAKPRRRIVVICYPVGLHGPFFFPEQEGREYTPSRYLKPLAEFRNDFTVFSGLSHARILRSHTGDKCFLTGAPYESYDSFRNTISLDQVAAGHVGSATRFSALTLGDGLSFAQNGTRLPGLNKPSEVFARLFLNGTATQLEAQARRLRDGQSIMDLVGDEAHNLRRDLPPSDRARLDEYLSSVRQLEKRLVEAEEWQSKPKPKVTAAPPRDVNPNADPVGHLRLMYDLIHLALQTDSTRVVSFHGGLLRSQPTIQGNALDYHNLSHHGQDPDKIAGVGLIEDELMKAFGQLLAKLKDTNTWSG